MSYEPKKSNKTTIDKQGVVCLILLAVALIILLAEVVLIPIFNHNNDMENIKSSNISTIPKIIDTSSTTTTTKVKKRESSKPTSSEDKVIKKKKKKKKNKKTSSVVSTTEPTTTVENNPTNNFLLAIDNVDPTYQGTTIALSESERTELAHLIMGEAGGEGFEGCCLLAQCVRDAMTYKGYNTISEVISGMNYSGYKYDTCQDVEDAIDYIFVQGNSAVQHRILVMYASDLCEGSWHETQNFIIQHNTVRFFDMSADA